MQHEQFRLHAEIEERHWWFVARRRIVRRLIRQVLPPSPEATIVDVGCGTGANLAALSDDYDCVGIDTSEEAIEWARKRFPGVEFRLGRAPDDLGDRMGQARLLLLMDVLEHVANDFAMFSELVAAASPQACFLITVPADMSLWSEHDESFGHLRRYDHRRLAELWADLPVTPLVLSYFNARMCPLIRMIRGINRLRGRASGRSGTDFWMPPGPLNRLLEAIFAGEARVVEDLLRGRRPRGYRAGASLMAIVQRASRPSPLASPVPSAAPEERPVGAPPL